MADNQDDGASLRQRVDSQHGLRLSHRQLMPDHLEPAVQDARSVQTQLYRSLSTVAALAGFDGVSASALESFKGLAEEFIVSFLETVCTSMIASRRTTPIPQDFILALAELDFTPTDFQQHLDLHVPDGLSCPKISTPPPDEAPPPDLKSMLGADLSTSSPGSFPQIPQHFPPLPSKHTWRATPLATTREKDPRRIRERATQEGIVAEQSLRRLQAAAHAPKHKSEQQMSAKEKERRKIWLDAMTELAGDMSQRTVPSNDGDHSMTGTADGESTDRTDSSVMVVNSDRINWRKGASLGAAHG